MGESHPRHRYGTYALIFALLALVFAGFSKGAVWATVDDESTTTIQDDFVGDITANASINSALHLREMETEIEGTIVSIDFGEEIEFDFSETETYDQLAHSSQGNVSSTFEDLDTAGAVAEWMIWIGIGSVIITVILCFCSLAQIAPSRPTLLAGGISSALLFFTPIVWFLLLPSDGTYTNDSILAPIAFWFEEEPELLIDFEPTPSTGVFLSILSGLSSAAMMAMLVLYNRAESTEEKPGWMIADDSTILPEPTLLDLISRDGDSISFNFSALKSQPKKLVMPVIQILLIILFSFALSGTWASYTVDIGELGGEGSADLSFTAEEVMVELGSESMEFPYDGDIDESWEEMGEVIGQSVTIGTIAIWMLILSLVWRFAVSTGGAQKIPALCQHHRIIDTSLVTGGSLLAFISLLYFTIKSPSNAELFTDIPNEIISGGTSFLILFLMVLLVPFSIAVFTFGEHGAPVRKFLHSFDIPIPGEKEDVATVTSSSERSEWVGTLLQNPFNNPRISGLPWLTIGVVILVLFGLGGGGFLVYNMVLSSGASETVSRNTYRLENDINSIQSEETVYANDQSTTWTLTTNEPMVGAIRGLEIRFAYEETGISDGLWDELEVELIDAPLMFDIANSTTSGSSNDGAPIWFYLYVDRGIEAQYLAGDVVNLTDDERTELLSYYNDHGGGIGEWQFSITINDSIIEDGEDVYIDISVRENELSALEEVDIE